MLLASQPPPSISTLNSPQAEEAVYEACNILNLSPAEMKNIVNSASTSNHNKVCTYNMGLDRRFIIIKQI